MIHVYFTVDVTSIEKKISDRLEIFEWKKSFFFFVRFSSTKNLEKFFDEFIGQDIDQNIAHSAILKVFSFFPSHVLFF